MLDSTVYRIGIDLGGTKIEAVALDGSGQILARHRVPTPRDSYAELLNSIKNLVHYVEHQVCESNPVPDPSPPRFADVGLCMPGSIRPGTQQIRNANLQILNGKALSVDLEQHLGRTVKLANDANCFALSEAVDGAAKGGQVVFGIILGTGCGGGLVINGSIWNGPNAIAGEWGHIRLPDPQSHELPGPACYCGQRGCIETFVSGTGLENDYLLETKQKASAKDIIVLCEQGDSRALKTFENLESRLARSLAMLINMIDPDIIVAGGGLSNVDRIYTNVPRLWGAYIFGDASRTKFVKALHGDSSGVRGAAWL